MTSQTGLRGRWATWPVLPRAVITGLLVGLIAANVWPPLLFGLGAPLAVPVEMVFLGLYVWWASGGGPPQRKRAARSTAFRTGALSRAQWWWSLLGAISFAVTIHAAIVLLFRFTLFPVEAFRQGYDSFRIPSVPLQWAAVVVSATSAGICEETGFRGYMQQPIEERHGVPIAILVSSFLFTLVHLTKAWALVGMVPIVFGAGVLLGLLAWSCRSLVPSIVGHVVMDIGLFAYWWTGIAGDFTARPIAETGIDRPFLLTCAVLATSLTLVLIAVWQLRRVTRARA